MIAEAHAKAALPRRYIVTGFAIGLAVIPVLPALTGGGSAVKAFLADIYQRYVGSSSIELLRSRRAGCREQCDEMAATGASPLHRCSQSLAT